MPNLAIAYRESVTAVATNRPGCSEAMDLFDLLGKMGKAVWLEESGFDLFTSVFGSGPAFILAFIQTFKEKMQEFNLPSPLLDELLLELTQGTTTYFTRNQQRYSIEELIQKHHQQGGEPPKRDSTTSGSSNWGNISRGYLTPHGSARKR